MHAAVGGAVEAVLGGVAEAAVADAEGAVDEDLELDVGHRFVDGAYLVDGELAGQHDAAETEVAQPRHLLGSAVVGLGAGVEF